jgi:hypothetical protein
MPRSTKIGKVAKQKKVKPVTLNEFGHATLQYNIPKGVEDDKRVKPSQVFEGFKEKNKQKKKYHNKNKK